MGNMTKKSTKINIFQVIAPVLGSREVVSSLKKIIIKTRAKRVDLDFKKVKFVSRSAAHELLKLKEELFYKNKKVIQFVNLNDDIAQMLKIVASSRAVSKKEIPKLKIDTVNITSLAG